MRTMRHAFALMSEEVNMTEVSVELVKDQLRTIECWAAFWSAHDIERLLALFTESVLYEDVTMGAVNRGVAELRAFVEVVFFGFPDVTFELRSSFANGTGGGAEWVMRGTHEGDLPGLPATGKCMDVRGASIVEFSGNKIGRCSDYWDMATLLNQLGLTRA
jgi:steroid delta-isomerase-like uncharacterized protein